MDNRNINDLMAVCVVTLAQFSAHSLFITEITGTLQFFMLDIVSIFSLQVLKFCTFLMKGFCYSPKNNRENYFLFQGDPKFILVEWLSHKNLSDFIFRLS